MQLEKVLETFPGEIHPFIEIYNLLGQALNESVSSHKKKETYRRIFSTSSVSALGIVSLATLQGIYNIIPDMNMPLLRVIGGITIFSALLTLTANIFALPSPSNFIYRIS